MDTATLVGTLGVSGILAGYFLNIAQKIATDSYAYLLLNLIGSLLACISSVLIGSIPFTALEGVWALVSLVALIQKTKLFFLYAPRKNRHKS